MGGRHCGSLDHLVGPQENRRRERETKGLGRLEVDDQLEPHRSLHREVSRLGPFEDFVYIDGEPLVQVIADQALSPLHNPSGLDPGHLGRPDGAAAVTPGITAGMTDVVWTEGSTAEP